MGFFSRKHDFYIPDDGIDRIKNNEIDGIHQTILIQSFTSWNPVSLSNELSHIRAEVINL
jgi:hypothetical protein